MTHTESTAPLKPEALKAATAAVTAEIDRYWNDDSVEPGHEPVAAAAIRAYLAAAVFPAPQQQGVKVKALTLADLQRAHIERQEEWCPEQKPDLSFRGNEMAGEVGEACNVIKKLERERQGWRGSRATKEQLAEELADVIHTAVLCAITAGIDIEQATAGKFDATSEKNNLSTRLSALTIQEPASEPVASLDERMEAAGMIPLSKILSGDTPLGKWEAHTGVRTLAHFEEWLLRRHREFMTMRARYAVGDKDESDELYEWVLAHAGAFSEVVANWRQVTATSILDRDHPPAPAVPADELVELRGQLAEAEMREATWRETATRAEAALARASEALTQIRDLGSDGDHSGDRHARCRDIARAFLERPE